MSEYRIHCLNLGNIVNGRCLEAEGKLNAVLGDHIQVLCIAPYTILAPNQPTILPNGRLMATPPNLIHSLIVVSEHPAKEEH